MEDKVRLKYPILLVHGMGFRDHKHPNYWGRIPKHLINLGAKVHYGKQDSNGSIETNAEFLKERINMILSESGASKLNIIAHSKGGLDIRYMISSLEIGDKVASLTTISTPHKGSKAMDKIFKIPHFLIWFFTKIADLWFRILGDRHPNTYRVLKSLRTKDAILFNQKNIDLPSIYYQSYAFTMERARSDIFLMIPNLFVGLIGGKNDGFLTPSEVEWGEFQGIIMSNSNRGISHMDEVDFRRRKLTKKPGKGISDILEVYTKIYQDLASHDL